MYQYSILWTYNISLSYTFSYDNDALNKLKLRFERYKYAVDSPAVEVDVFTTYITACYV